MTVRGVLIAKGLAASPGIGRGEVAMTAAEAEAFRMRGVSYVLFANDVSREDIDAVRGAAGVVSPTGGITGDVAVVARALGKPCVVSASVRLLASDRVIEVGDPGRAARRLGRADVVVIDGRTGEIFVDE